MVYNSLLVGLVSPLLLFLGVDGKPAELSYADGVVRSATAPVVSYTSLPRGTGPYTGMMPAVTGAATGSIRGTAISAMPPGAEATRYPADGTLNNTQPAPYLPGGGLGTNGTMPVYNVQSDYDYQSIVGLQWTLSRDIRPKMLSVSSANLLRRHRPGPSFVLRLAPAGFV